VSIVHGTPEQRRAAMMEPADVYLINPENVDWLSGYIGNWFTGKWGTTPGMLVVDESTRFKNAQSKRFKALKHFMGAFPAATS
jgi:hypothetical protein